MRLGLSTYTFPWNFGIKDFLPTQPWTYNELLNYAAEKQISNLQFGDNYPLHHLSPESLARLQQLAGDKRIQIEVGTRRLETDHILRYLRIARQLQSPFLRVVIDDAGFHPDVETVIGTIRKLLPAFERAGVCLALENHDRFKAATFEHIIRETDPALVGICLDTANSLGAAEGIAEVLPVLLPHTVNLHVKDFTIDRVAHRMGFTIRGAAAGEGVLDIPWLLQECSKQPKCKTATLEIWMNKENTIAETIARELRWVEQSISYLTKYIL